MEFWAYGSGSLMSGHGMWILPTSLSQVESLGKTQRVSIHYILFFSSDKLTVFPVAKERRYACTGHPYSKVDQM